MVLSACKTYTNWPCSDNTEAQLVQLMRESVKRQKVTEEDSSLKMMSMFQQWRADEARERREQQREQREAVAREREKERETLLELVRAQKEMMMEVVREMGQTLRKNSDSPPPE